MLLLLLHLTNTTFRVIGDRGVTKDFRLAVFSWLCSSNILWWYSAPTTQVSTSAVFPLFSRFRIMCHYICNHSLFGNVVLVCIMVSSFMLAAEDPLNSNSEHNKVSNIFSKPAIISFDASAKLETITFAAKIKPSLRRWLLLSRSSSLMLKHFLFRPRKSMQLLSLSWNLW